MAEAVHHQLAGLGAIQAPHLGEVVGIGEGNGDAGSAGLLVVKEQCVGAVGGFRVQLFGGVQPGQGILIAVGIGDGDAVVEPAALGDALGFCQRGCFEVHRQSHVAVGVGAQGEGVVHLVGGTGDACLGGAEHGRSGQGRRAFAGAGQLHHIGAEGQVNRLAVVGLAHLHGAQCRFRDIILAEAKVHILAIVVAHTNVEFQHVQHAEEAIQVDAQIHTGQLDGADEGDVRCLDRAGGVGFKKVFILFRVMYHGEVTCGGDDAQNADLNMAAEGEGGIPGDGEARRRDDGEYTHRLSMDAGARHGHIADGNGIAVIQQADVAGGEGQTPTADVGAERSVQDLEQAEAAGDGDVEGGWMMLSKHRIVEIREAAAYTHQP